MGEAKRRKKLNPDYGKKTYSIEFIDFETYKRDFVDRFDDDPNLKVPEEELELFNRTFWMGYINIQDSKYSFLLLLGTKETNQDGFQSGANLYIETSEKPEHKRIIAQNHHRIEEELLDKALPEFEKFLIEKMEVDDDYFDEDEDDFYDDDDHFDDDYDDYFDEDDEEKIEIDYEQIFNDPDIGISHETLLSSDKWVYRPLNDYDWTRGKLEHLAQAIATRETDLPNNLTKEQMIIIYMGLSKSKTRSEVYQKLEKIKEELIDEQHCFTDSLYEKVEEYLDNREKLYEEIMEKCLSKGIYRYHFIPDGGNIRFVQRSAGWLRFG